MRASESELLPSPVSKSALGPPASAGPRSPAVPPERRAGRPSERASAATVAARVPHAPGAWERAPGPRPAEVRAPRAWAVSAAGRASGGVPGPEAGWPPEQEAEERSLRAVAPEGSSLWGAREPGSALAPADGPVPARVVAAVPERERMGGRSAPERVSRKRRSAPRPRRGPADWSTRGSPALQPGPSPASSPRAVASRAGPREGALPPQRRAPDSGSEAVSGRDRARRVARSWPLRNRSGREAD